MNKKLIIEIVATARQVQSSNVMDYYEHFKTLVRTRGATLEPDFLQALKMLEGVCSFHLNPTDAQPLGALAIFPPNRTMIPEDLSPEQLTALKGLSAADIPPVMQARICDTLWLRNKDHEAARLAVCAYTTCAKESIPEHWPQSEDYIVRALIIARQLDRNGQDTRDVEQWMSDRWEEVTVDSIEVETRYWPLALGRIMLDQAVPEIDYKDFADKCVMLSGVMTDPDSKTDYLEMAARAYTKVQDKANCAAVFKEIGKTWEEVALAELQSESGSGLRVAHRLNKAIDANRAAGEKAKAEELLKRMKEANKLTISQMTRVQVTADLTPMMDKVVEEMKHMVGPEAIQSLRGLSRPPILSEMKAESTRSREEFPLKGFAKQQVLSFEGNVVATGGGELPGGPDKSFLALSEQYKWRRATVGAMIEVACEEIRQDKDALWKQALADAVAENAFVDPSKKELLARGIIDGITGNLAGFLHLTIPQLESMARAIVAHGGGKTTSLKSGVMQELDLNQMLKDESEGFAILQKALGEDLAWDLRMLLVEAAGPNLRNQVCHGLISWEGCYSHDSWYLAWQVLCVLEATKGIVGT